MTKIINFYAGPGAGKSTNAAGLFYVMKRAGIKAELVQEYAKDLVWDGSFDLLKNQLLVVSEQIHRQQRLLGKVEYVITDSPVPLAVLYAKEEDKRLIEMVVDNYYQKSQNINVFVNRTKKFVQEGRVHSLEESKGIDKLVADDLGIVFDFNIDSSGDVSKLMKDILAHDNNII